MCILGRMFIFLYNSQGAKWVYRTTSDAVKGWYHFVQWPPLIQFELHNPEIMLLEKRYCLLAIVPFC